MVMERLGGFRLCRRLPDTDGRLLPFLSAEAMVGTMLEERPARASRGAAGPEGMETLAPGKATHTGTSTGTGTRLPRVVSG